MLYISHTIKEITILMISDGEKWHCLAVKKLSVLFCKIISKHDGDFYWPHSFRTENKL